MALGWRNANCQTPLHCQTPLPAAERYAHLTASVLLLHADFLDGPLDTNIDRLRYAGEPRRLAPRTVPTCWAVQGHSQPTQRGWLCHHAPDAAALCASVILACAPRRLFRFGCWVGLPA